MASTPPTRGPAPARPRRLLMPVLATLLVVTWQYSFNYASPDPDQPYRMRASMGLCQDANLFFYFFYHLGLFPVGSAAVPQLGPSTQDAIAYVQRHGQRLQMDFDETTNTPRFGDYGKMFLFYPDAWIRHDPAHPSLRAFDELLVITALVAVIWAFWFEGRAALGVWIVVLVGSNPFQRFETYTNPNVFSIPIATTLLALAVHLGYVSGRRTVDRWAWPIAVASGVVLATLRDARAEAAVCGVSVLATYLWIRRATWVRRGLLALTFVAAFLGTARAWDGFWRHKFVEAEQMVQRAGGQVFRGAREMHHVLWHAVYCGLGDYGQDRGFVWGDDVPIHWATTFDPVTNPHPLPYHYDGGPYLRETYDGFHHIAPTDLPEYNRLVRQRVLHEIVHHPLWYGRILCRRLIAILGDATPASLAVGPVSVEVTWAGWLLVPALLLLLWRRKNFETRLILFTVPLSAVAFLVYSGKGMTYYGIAHLIALAIGLDLLGRALSGALRARFARPASDQPGRARVR